MDESGQHHAPAALYLQVPTRQEAGWTREAVWTERLQEQFSFLYCVSNPDCPVV
jgi:hypothetical protein